METPIPGFTLRFGEPVDVPLILRFIEGLAEYERLDGVCVASQEALRETLFGERRFAEVVLGHFQGEPVGFALFFHNYSTFLAKPGLYLEDLFILPEWRGRGFGGALFSYLARLAVERGCGRMEWVVLNWNEDAIGFYDRMGAEPLDGWTTYRLTGDPLRSLAGEAA